MTICVRFDNGNADFAQQHDNFESFLKGQIENLNLSANISNLEWDEWFTAFNGLAGTNIGELDLDATLQLFLNQNSGIFDAQRAEEMLNLYKLIRIAYFETFGLGKDDVLGTYITNTTSNSFFECFDIWIWCWDEYPDFELTGVVVLPGITGTSLPPYQINYDELMFCEGYLEPHDTGVDNPDSVHPNFEFCEIWMTYLEDCILPNAELVEGYNGGYQNLIMQWAQFQYYFEDDFNEAIADSDGCGTTTNTLPPAISEECRDALNLFEETYGLNLTIAERKAILFGIDPESCGDNFDDLATDILMEECLAEIESAGIIMAAIDNEGLYDDCPLPFAWYVPCSEVIFSDPIAVFNQRICHIETKIAWWTLACLPPPSESEWGKLDVSMKFEFRIPNFAFNGMFGYENNQTIVATIISDAFAYAWNLIVADIKCSNAVSKRGEFRQFVMDYLKDISILSKDEY